MIYVVATRFDKKQFNRLIGDCSHTNGTRLWTVTPKHASACN